ncbi:CD99 antigen-like protein 2 [Amblyraja radiata]|uniref:CD99 antigen-like protein 2 n=1 Tax=Amblyraja radiata TaxID=386614 RepID=UPI0014040196|nr:CD99 antigen-like protein 2 [Amblyraja radiata]
MARARLAVLLCAALTLLLERVSCDNGFDLEDAIPDDRTLMPTPAKPRKQTGGTDTGECLHLLDFLRTTKPPRKTIKTAGTTKKPPNTDSDSDLDLADALDDNNDKSKRNPGNPDRPSTPRSNGNKHKEGGSDFSDSELDDVLGGGDYKPDERKKDDPLPPDDQKDVALPETTIAGIVTAVAATLVGAISSYIAYQKKQLCFKMQGTLNQVYLKGENVEAGTMSEPQAERNLLETQSEKPPADVACKV